MADDAVVLRGSFDGKDFEFNLAKTRAKVESEAKKMGGAMDKFALSGEGVLQKLARQWSATDLVAGAAFATVAKGTQVVLDSVKAYEDQQRALRKAGFAYDEVVDRLDANSKKIKDNNEIIGQNAIFWKEWGSDVEVALSGVIAKIGEFIQKNKEAADYKLQTEIGNQFAGKGHGAPSVTINKPAGSTHEYYGPSPELLGQMDDIRYKKEQEDAAKAAEKATRDALAAEKALFNARIRQAEQAQALAAEEAKRLGFRPSLEQEARSSFMGTDWFGDGSSRPGEPSAHPDPNFNKYFETRDEYNRRRDKEEKYNADHKFGEIGDSQEMFEQLFETQDEYNARLQRQANDLAMVNNAIGAFSGSLSNGLVSALVNGTSAIDAFKSAMMSMVQSLLDSAIKSAFSFIPVIGPILGGVGAKSVSGGGRYGGGTEPTTSPSGRSAEPSFAPRSANAYKKAPTPAEMDWVRAVVVPTLAYESRRGRY